MRVHRWCRCITTLALACVGTVPVQAQIRVSPTGVSVNVQDATTVFLTFGGVVQRTPADAEWCGELVSATPDIGVKCEPATIFGRLPARYDHSRLSASGAFTDIMSIPPSVTRRAYDAARSGKTSTFFYVRRFVSAAGGPDEYVAVTCRPTGGGARVPFALTDVQLDFEPATPVLFVRPGVTPPALEATIRYNGTGRLTGRWEVVLPGEPLPVTDDLLTEATLPPDQRGSQRRFTQLERFDIFLPPNGGGTVRLPGPDPHRLPANVEGSYLVLLRVEAADDREGDSDLGAVGAGSGIVHSGAVAGFPMPVLRYVVGAGESALDATTSPRALRQLLPRADAQVSPDSSFEVSWIEEWRAGWYRVEFETAGGASLLDAIVRPGIGAYRAPSFLAARAAGQPIRWRVLQFDPLGTEVRQSPWRPLAFVAPAVKPQEE